MRKILIVEDEPILRESYMMILSTEPYEVYAASNGEEAFRICEANKLDLVLLDMMMPKVDGVMFLEKCKSHNIELPKVILLSNISSGEELGRALALGVHRTAVKADLSPKELITMVRYEMQT